MPFPARFRPHPRGFGFLNPVEADGLSPTTITLTDDDGAESTVDSVFVAPPLARTLLADDLVEAEAALGERGATATTTRLLERARRMLVGRVQHGPSGLVLEPDPALGSGWIALEPAVASRLPTAVGRQVVVLGADRDDSSPIGRALVAGPHIVGSPQAVRAASVVIALGRAAPSLVPGGPAAAGLDPLEAQTTHTRVVGLLAGGGRGGAAGLDFDGPVPGHDVAWVDRRDEPCITVDDAATRDVDDAIAARWDGAPDSDVEVVVHIADVAGQVGIDSPADRYARSVAATAYLAVGENAPMLDPALSEDLLSLLPGQDRWAVSARFAVAPDGTLGLPRVEVAAVTSRAKLSYAAVEDWLDGNQDALIAQAGSEATIATGVLRAATEASRRLGVERDARTTFEELFASAEVTPAIVGGKLTTVPAEPHAAAYRLIERLMVAANEAVARWLVERQVPALYRAHAGLAPDRADRLRAAAELAGVELPALAQPDAEADAVVAEVLGAIEQLDVTGRTADRDLLIGAATSATARATYDPDPSHHRGLASEAYCHFTSPIRRYADLVVHRQLRAALAGAPPPLTSEQLTALAGWLDARAGAMKHLQARERAELWSRLLDRGYLDDAEEAVITGVTVNGLRIRLPRLGVTGFVTAERVLDLPARERGSFEVDEHGLTTTTGTWRVGGRLMVRCIGLDPTGRANWRVGTVGG